jgi:hypothetical protein
MSSSDGDDVTDFSIDSLELELVFLGTRCVRTAVSPS